MLVADLCNQADNANQILTADAARLTPEQIDQWAQGKAVADTICLDQSAAASSSTLEAKLRSTIPALVALIPVKE